eukprot:15366640-Ditylum_brightwellii.AAC.1
MDVVLDSACIHHLHLNPINWSRLFIRACFISDISSADGKYLASIFYQPDPPSALPYTKDYSWPHKEVPNQTTWQIFMGQLKKILCHADGQLKEPLDYVASLDAWEQDLIHKVKFVVDEEDLHMVLNDEITLFLVPDGGTENGYGYFGWVIVSHMDILAQHSGHAAGNLDLMESLQTESIGALSLLCVLVCFCRYYNVTINVQL